MLSGRRSWRQGWLQLELRCRRCLQPTHMQAGVEVMFFFFRMQSCMCLIWHAHARLCTPTFQTSGSQMPHRLAAHLTSCKACFNTAGATANQTQETLIAHMHTAICMPCNQIPALASLPMRLTTFPMLLRCPVLPVSLYLIRQVSPVRYGGPRQCLARWGARLLTGCCQSSAQGRAPDAGGGAVLGADQVV